MNRRGARRSACWPSTTATWTRSRPRTTKARRDLSTLPTATGAWPSTRWRGRWRWTRPRRTVTRKTQSRGGVWRAKKRARTRGGVRHPVGASSGVFSRSRQTRWRATATARSRTRPRSRSTTWCATPYSSCPTTSRRRGGSASCARCSATFPSCKPSCVWARAPRSSPTSTARCGSLGRRGWRSGTAATRVWARASTSPRNASRRRRSGTRASWTCRSTTEPPSRSGWETPSGTLHRRTATSSPSGTSSGGTCDHSVRGRTRYFRWP